MNDADSLIWSALKITLVLVVLAAVASATGGGVLPWVPILGTVAALWWLVSQLSDL
jgi:hypothetical protein